MTHWADVEAKRLVQARDAPYLFATAITPSGPIHVGNMREVLTTEAVFRAAKDLGAAAELIYIADDYDPLRKVYPFLVHNAAGVDYTGHVGKPLREIPCPCGGHPDYAGHFLEPFLENLGELGIRPTVLSAYDMYLEGRYGKHIVKSLDEAPRIRAIIEEVSKRRLAKDWAPFHPQCPVCRRINGVSVLVYEFPELQARCAACTQGTDDPDAGTFTVDVRTGGVGKLPWRVDWPARWDFLGVTFEAFGKDHGAKGGSWDTGVRIVREVFEGREPEHVMYEFLNLKGRGAMHSSTGLAVSAEEVLRMTPPEVLRYLLMRQSPRKHIDFDPGLGLLNLVDEFDRLERIAHGAEENPGTFTEVERTYALSCPAAPPEHLPRTVAYRHLVTVVQIAADESGSETARVKEVLRRSGSLPDGMDEVDEARLAQRCAHVRYWVEHFAPDEVRFAVQDDLPVAALRPGDEVVLSRAAAALEAVAEWDGKAIHDALYGVKDALGLKPPQVFAPVYRAVLGQDRGPRAGFFLASLERDWVVARLRSAAHSLS